MNTRKINLTNLNKVLISILLVGIILYLGRLFLIPVAIATFFAMLLFPVSKRLEGLKFPRPIAVLSSILILISVLGILSLLVYYQTKKVEADLPDLKKKIEEKTSSLQWIFYRETGISANEQDEIIEEKKPDIFADIGKALKDLFIHSLYILLVFFVVLAYLFLFLIYRRKLVNFFIKLDIFETENEARTILYKITEIAHEYLKGVLIVISLLSVVYFLGFWIIGVKHALLFAIITALLRIVPYLGSFVGIAFPIAFSFLTEDTMSQALLVLGFFMVTQVFEAYVLTPNITGSKVKLNPLATIMIILLGSLIWGIAGMILFVPIFGILKVVCDQIPKLRPYGYILGKDE